MDENISTEDRFRDELGMISYLELQKHFAKGIVLLVDSGLDVIEVALAIHADDTAQVQKWVDDQAVTRAHDEHAKSWLDEKTVFQAVTVAPWVLVQEVQGMKVVMRNNDEEKS